ncbi:helix-turn-helix domain-containing protein [Dysgonomonas capnocytophagoides]|uniref:helix-turn-helix domain-containing protein n=1 Tax=Dysgonomonas capnocytophagoides TaxID=45254 RepID=UPI003340B0D6
MNFRIKEILKEKGLTMEQLSERLGITRITLTRNINGNPTIDTLQKIAKELNVDFLELFATTSKTELTALIEYKNDFYKAETIEELEKIILLIKSK